MGRPIGGIPNSDFYRNLLDGEITALVRMHTALRRANAADNYEDEQEYLRQAKAYRAQARETHQFRIKEESQR